MKKISIVILDYKNKKDTSECINSIGLLDVTGIDLTLIVVNNDITTTYTKDDFSNKFPLTIVNSEKNDGYSGGNNRGIKQALAAAAEYILLLNNDTIVSKDVLQQLLDVVEKNTNVGLVSPKIYFAKGSEYHKDRYTEKDLGKVFWYAGGEMDWKNVIGKHRGVDEVDTGQYDVIEQTDFTTGCCMFFTAELIKKIGFFDERYFLYYEDSDFNQRVKMYGLKTMYAPTAVIWHKNAGSTGGSGSTLQDYFISRNRMVFGMKYAPVRSKIALVKEGLNILRTGRVWQKKGITDYFLGKGGKGSYQLS